MAIFALFAAVATVLFLTPTRRLGWSVAASAAISAAILTTIQVQSNLGSDFGQLVDASESKKVWVANRGEVLIAAGMNLTLGLVAAAAIAGLVLAVRWLHR